jgi:hypothetical protein
MIAPKNKGLLFDLPNEINFTKSDMAFVILEADKNAQEYFKERIKRIPIHTNADVSKRVDNFKYEVLALFDSPQTDVNTLEERPRKATSGQFKSVVEDTQTHTFPKGWKFSKEGEKQ